MAKVRNAILTKGFSGTIGRELTFRQIGGETFVSKYQKRPGTPPTEIQVAAREKFGLATAFAKRAVKNPELKAFYQSWVTGGQRAYNVAIIDALHAPVVDDILMEKFNGLVGDPITIRASDNIKVAQVFVTINNPQGILIEHGDAVVNTNDPNEWVYYSKRQNAEKQGLQITAEAKDIPGNIGSLTVHL
jgi:hypothetical protein